MVMGWVRVPCVPGSPPAHSQSFTCRDFVAKGQLAPQAHMAGQLGHGGAGLGWGFSASPYLGAESFWTVPGGGHIHACSLCFGGHAAFHLLRKQKPWGSPAL